jgi:hypothetical protein
MRYYVIKLTAPAMTTTATEAMVAELPAGVAWSKVLAVIGRRDRAEAPP